MKDAVNELRQETNRAVNHCQYTPLPGGRYTRVLELHPGAGDEPLRGTLSDVSLDDSSLEFEALSYVWGAGYENAGTVSLGGGQCLELRPNLTGSPWLFMCCL
ncbi:hypothetical protein INS49_001229 [Diaporthe citri]|uniref:uncharacterized protein n=1 Tax=Diaporthe citri TaxID=83186 RepID=UPI001C7EF501|nr:uncharacterized protein INS49_001229 [Diaporthe citri]KAG6367047.1 hypothetical protein INS49_001229 [Diaporthe citri]